MTGGEFFLGAAACGLIAVFGFVTGTALGKPSFERAVRPAGYWAVQACWCLLSAGLCIAGAWR